MTMGFAPRKPVETRSKALFHFRARDAAIGLQSDTDPLKAISGQANTFTRAGADASALDNQGRVYQAIHSQLRLQWTDGEPALLLGGPSTNLVDEDDLTLWTGVSV